MVSFSVLFPYVSRILIGAIFEVPYLNDFLIFIELYCVGGYLKLYGLQIKKIWVVLGTISALIFGGVITYTDVGWYAGTILEYQFF